MRDLYDVVVRTCDDIDSMRVKAENDEQAIRSAAYHFKQKDAEKYTPWFMREHGYSDRYPDSRVQVRVGLVASNNGGGMVWR